MCPCVSGRTCEQATAGVEVTLDASELENLDESMLKEKYEDTIQGAKNAREDVSDVFEEQVLCLYRCIPESCCIPPYHVTPQCMPSLKIPCISQ